MRDWKHSGFSVDTSVRIEARDHLGMQRLVEYISRCPFSLARMISITEEGKVIYRAGKAESRIKVIPRWIILAAPQATIRIRRKSAYPLAEHRSQDSSIRQLVF